MKLYLDIETATPLSESLLGDTLLNKSPISEYLHGYRLPIKHIMPLGKKPWETTTQDTKEKWKMGSYMNTSSLKDICACLNIPTPKDDISGKDVSSLFWNGGERGLVRINKYCAKDVLATMAVYYIMEQAGEIMTMPASYEYIINNKSI